MGCMRLLLEHCADPNGKVKNNSTPLHAITKSRHDITTHHHRCIDILFAEGIDPNVKDNDGNTPYLGAVCQNNKCCISELEKWHAWELFLGESVQRKMESQLPD